MDQTDMRAQTTSGAIKAGWVCLILGLVLTLIPIPLMQLLSIVFFISAPLCFVAFILSIVGLAKGQVVKGIALLISTIVLPIILLAIGTFGSLKTDSVSSTGRGAGQSETISRASSATASTRVATPPANKIAAGLTAQNIAGTAPLYCLDSTGAYQPFVRTNYGGLQQAFMSEFGYRSSLYSTSDSLGILTFSVDGELNAQERIYYDVEVHNGGIALLHMHVRLTGVSESNSGTEMCWKTFALVDSR